MLTELTLFGACLALGLASGFLHAFLSFIFKKLANRSAAVTAQFLLAGATVCSFTLITFLINDGQFTLYSACALTIGFLLACVICLKSNAKKPRNFPQKQNQAKQ